MSNLREKKGLCRDSLTKGQKMICIIIYLTKKRSKTKPEAANKHGGTQENFLLQLVCGPFHLKGHKIVKGPKPNKCFIVETTHLLQGCPKPKDEEC